MPNRMIAPPMTSSVRLWPMPQKIPVQAALPNLALPANDGGNGDDMIGIGRVPHAEKETKEQDGKKRAHEMAFAISLGMNRTERIAHSSPSITRAAFPQPGHSRVAMGIPCKRTVPIFRRSAVGTVRTGDFAQDRFDR